MLIKNRGRRLFGTLGICAALAFGIAAAVALPASAKGPHNHGHVTICHATPPDTAANGYVRISPSASGVYHGHYRQHDADIIPPFTYKGTTYSLNWDASGQAIWNNGCQAPDTTTTTTTTTTGGVAGGTKTVTHRARPSRPHVAAANFAG